MVVLFIRGHDHAGGDVAGQPSRSLPLVAIIGATDPAADALAAFGNWCDIESSSVLRTRPAHHAARCQTTRLLMHPRVRAFRSVGTPILSCCGGREGEVTPGRPLPPWPHDLSPSEPVRTTRVRVTRAQVLPTDTSGVTNTSSSTGHTSGAASCAALLRGVVIAVGA